MSLPAPLENAAVPLPIVGVLQTLLQAGHEAFLVGGCVRDLFLGKTPKDWDVTTQARPEEVQKLFRKVIPTGILHGTVTVLTTGASVEVTTYRFEGEYVDGRRPSTVEFRRDLQEDLARRDFTINAMAFNPAAEDFRDPFGGQADLALKRVRCVGAASARFGEDGLRALRAVRFAAVLGFELDPETEAAIRPTLPVFRKVALERVQQEFVKVLLARDAERGLQLLERTGLLAEFVPEVEAAHEPFAHVAAAEQEDAVRLAALLVQTQRPRDILMRLKFPTRTAEQVGVLVRERLGAEAHAWDAPSLRRWLVRVGPENVEPSLKLARARGVPGADALLDTVHAVLAEKPPLSPKALALNGQQLMALLGVPPSPLVGQATRYLMEAVLDDPRRNTVETLETLARAWVQKRS